MTGSSVRVPAAALVEAFFASGSVVSHPTIRHRAARIRAHLETFLDTEAEGLLGYDDLVLLEAQRQFDPVGAVLRIGDARLLLRALPGFCQTAWLLPDPADARAQLWTVLALRDWIGHEQPATLSPPSHQRISRAVRSAHAVLDDISCHQHRSTPLPPTTPGP